MKFNYVKHKLISGKTNSLMLELQEDITTGKSDVITLLRKARIIANLESNEFMEWITKELDGYGLNEDIPEYRKIECSIRDTIHGDFQRGVQISNSPLNLKPQIKNMTQTVTIYLSIMELKNICDDNENPRIKITLSPQIENESRKPIDFTVICTKSQLKTIIDHVINELLDWLLKLSKKGSLVENFSAPDDEKSIAKSEKFNSPIYINNSNVQIGNYNNQTNTNELKNELKNDKPNSTLLNKCVTSLKSIFEGLSGNILAQLLLQYIENIISLLSNIKL
ncbi:MAG: hypothetical protein LBM96_00215 [Methanobrevibacter sp.]|jgi:hypothetical protein|nr:hypothetical protein [Candidatus Methanoflexus mossambicus]